MQTAAVFVALLAAASASSVAFRVPSADSAVITSQRQGGNFAYSTQEAQAFGVVSPVVSQFATPVATTYSVQQPLVQTIQQQQPLIQTVQQQQPFIQTVQQQQLVQSVQQQPIVQSLQNFQTVSSVQVQQPIQQLTYTAAVQPQQVDFKNLEVKNVPVATTYVAGNAAPLWNQWYGNTVAPVQYAVVDAKKVQTVEKPVQYGYSIQQGQQFVASSPVVQAVSTSGVPVLAATTYTAASVVEKGTPADTYKTIAGVSPLGFNTVAYGVGQPWTGYQVAY